MTEWRYMRLGDVCELKRGYDLPNSERREGGVPVVSSSGTTGSHDTAKVCAPGVVTGRYGTLGNVYFIEEDYWPLNTALYVRDFRGNDPRFVFYLLAAANLQASEGAAAVPGVNRNVLHELRVRCPDVREQRRIATLLAAFDELIENNRRRIEILEETARSLYREWFVHYRFPGHESVELVESPLGPIPQGWCVAALGDHVEFRYGKALKKDARRGGDVAVVGSAGVVGWHDEALLDGPGIVVGRKGNVGSVIWVDGPFHPIDTTYFVVSEHPMVWLRYLLEGITFRDSHAAVPGLNRDDAMRTNVVIPLHPVVELFVRKIDPVLALSHALRSGGSGLEAARDLALPKLVTGQIDVDALSIDDVFGWAEAASA